jgi:hypothetical protein
MVRKGGMTMPSMRYGRTGGAASLATLVLSLAAALVAPAPAGAQVRLLTLDQTVPIAATLDNPCTAVQEAVAFQGTVHLVEEVWQTPTGALRLIVSEETSIQGRDLLVLFGWPLYTAAGTSDADIEALPRSLSIQSYKKVFAQGIDDNFHVVLAMVFDPSTLKIDLGLRGACDAGLP